MNAEQHAQMARESSHDDDVARERGRLFAARAIIENPEQRKRVEAVYGVAYCAHHWPEAYTVNTRTGGWREVLRWIPRMTDIMNPSDRG